MASGPCHHRGTLRSLPGIHSTDGAVVSDQAGQDRSDGPQSWNPQGAQRNVEQSLPIFASASIVFYFGNQKWGWVFNVFQCWGNGINQQDETSHPLDLGQLERSHWMDDPANYPIVDRPLTTVSACYAEQLPTKINDAC